MVHCAVANRLFVCSCTLRSSGQNFAVKRVPKPQPGQTSHSAEQPTVEALRNNSHLVSTCEVLDGANTMDYVMELHSGGDLFEWIATRGAVSEVVFFLEPVLGCEPLSQDRARAIFAGVLAGINQASEPFRVDQASEAWATHMQGMDWPSYRSISHAHGDKRINSCTSFRPIMTAVLMCNAFHTSHS